jgi:hypothetical protein
MKISSKNIANLAVAATEHPVLEHLKLNFNFNELGSEDIKAICESLGSITLQTLDFSFKGCGLPRNAFKRMSNWLLDSVDIIEKIALDFTL